MPQKCQNSDSQFPNKMKVSIKIIGNPLSILVALNAESAGTSPHAARAEEKGSVKWWTTFPSHHFSLPYINHLHPIMIKSGTMIMSFYCGPGTWSFFSMISKYEKEWHFIFAPGGHVRLINGNQLQWRCLSCIKCLDCQPRSSHLIGTHTHTQYVSRAGRCTFLVFHVTCLRGCSNSGRRMTSMWRTVKDPITQLTDLRLLLSALWL